MTAATPTQATPTALVMESAEVMPVPRCRSARERTRTAPGMGRRFAAVDSTDTRAASPTGTLCPSRPAVTRYSQALVATVAGTPSSGSRRSTGQRTEVSTAGRLASPTAEAATNRTTATSSRRRSPTPAMAAR
jgi:hypothetical protein